MKKTLDIKKLILLNMPYILLGLFATNFGEAWRMAQGADASEKFLSLVAVLPGALQSFWPSLHPMDLLIGVCCGAGLRLAVYLKGKMPRNIAMAWSTALPAGVHNFKCK
nr:conjugal transfer protein TraG [Butyricicoccus sp. AM27-36]